MTSVLAILVVGLGAGILSGAFGVGGGVLTTPAVRLLLGYPALVAVGTPLVAVVPAAITGAFVHARTGHVDVRMGLTVGAWGAVAAVAGARGSALVGGTAVMIITAAVIVWGAVSMLRPPAGARGRSSDGTVTPVVKRTPVSIAVLGVATGLYSGFLGLGGGVVLVPFLHRFFGLTVKTAIGTSLVAITVLAVPGSLAHWWLGHVEIDLALGLAIGAVPGALLGARFTTVASERWVRIGFACVLAVVGAILGVSESGLL